MHNKLKIIIAAVAVGFSFRALANSEALLSLEEKCYCIALAGQNDCSTPRHACVAQGTKDFDCNDWKYVTRGSCQRIGGSTIPGKEPINSNFIHYISNSCGVGFYVHHPHYIIKKF